MSNVQTLESQNVTSGIGVAEEADQHLGADLLKGAGPVSAFLGMTPRQVYHLHAKGDLPTFRIGHTLYARKSTLRAHIAALESGRLAKAS